MRARHLNSGRGRGWLARVSLASAACLADVNQDGGIDTLDGRGFVSTAENSEAAADLDGSGTVDLFDMIDFLKIFDAGCP